MTDNISVVKRQRSWVKYGNHLLGDGGSYSGKMPEKKESQRETPEARRQAVNTVFRLEADSHKYAS